jgi:hypothetical protein
MGKKKDGRMRQTLRMPVAELEAVYTESIYGEPANWAALSSEEQYKWMEDNPSIYELEEIERKDSDLERGTESFRLVIRRVADGRLFATIGGADINENWFGSYDLYESADDFIELQEVFEETITKIIYV